MKALFRPNAPSPDESRKSEMPVTEGSADRSRQILSEVLKAFPVAAILGDSSDRPEFQYFLEWLERGDHGRMDWMARNPVRRRSLQEGYPGYRTIVMALLPVGGRGDPLVISGEPVRIARYAEGPDYHKEFDVRFRQVAERIRPLLDPEDRPVIKPDHGALMEKSLAMEAGLGAIGKNTLLINPVLGSHFTIGSLLLKTPLASLSAPFERFSPCGNCTICLDACPTEAFRGPYRLNATRCLAYLTIEAPGDENRTLRQSRGEEWLFGCDICQDVCPHNRHRGRESSTPARTANLADRVVNHPTDLIEWVRKNPAMGRVSSDVLRERFLEITSGRSGAPFSSPERGK